MSCITRHSKLARQLIKNTQHAGCHVDLEFWGGTIGNRREHALRLRTRGRLSGVRVPFERHLSPARLMGRKPAAVGRRWKPLGDVGRRWETLGAVGSRCAVTGLGARGVRSARATRQELRACAAVVEWSEGSHFQQLRVAAAWLQPSRRRDCHFDDNPWLSVLKHLMKVQGGAIK